MEEPAFPWAAALFAASCLFAVGVLGAAPGYLPSAEWAPAPPLALPEVLLAPEEVAEAPPSVPRRPVVRPPVAAEVERSPEAGEPPVTPLQVVPSSPAVVQVAPASPSPATERPLAWQLRGRGAQAVLIREATRDVTDRLGRPGRPALRIRCVRGRLQLGLLPGVPSLERRLASNGVPSEQVEVVVELPGRQPHTLRFRAREGSAEVTLPKRRSGLVQSMGQAGEVSMSYLPFAARPVTAVFDVQGLDEALSALPCGPVG